MRPVYGEPNRTALWVSERIGRLIHPPFMAIGWTRNGRDLCAGAVFNDYYERGNIELTLACDGPMARSMFAEIARYVFVQLKCSRLSVTTSIHNEPVKDLAIRAGFKPESVRADYYGEGDHAALFRMKRRECKWLRS